MIWKKKLIIENIQRTDETNWFEIDDDDKTDKLGKALVDYQDSDSDGETDPDKTPVPGESASTSKEETQSEISQAEQESNADNEMSADVAKEGTENNKPSEEIKDEQVPELENIAEEIKSKENLNEDVKVGDKLGWAATKLKSYNLSLLSHFCSFFGQLQKATAAK